MNVRRLPLAFREALALHEAFRRLGFPSDDLFFLVSEEPTTDSTAIYIALRSGGHEFNALAGMVLMSKKHAMERWTEIVEAVADRERVDEASLLWLWDNSHVRRNVVSFIASLASHGIECPGGLRLN